MRVKAMENIIEFRCEECIDTARCLLDAGTAGEV